VAFRAVGFINLSVCGCCGFFCASEFWLRGGLSQGARPNPELRDEFWHTFASWVQAKSYLKQTFEKRANRYSDFLGNSELIVRRRACTAQIVRGQLPRGEPIRRWRSQSDDATFSKAAALECDV